MMSTYMPIYMNLHVDVCSRPSKLELRQVVAWIIRTLSPDQVQGPEWARAAGYSEAALRIDAHALSTSELPLPLLLSFDSTSDLVENRTARLQNLSRTLL